MYGGSAFFVQAAAATGGLSFLPRSLEFPVWRPDRVVRDAAGRTIVGLPSGRIQVYDASGRFERGWFVPASGGDFVIAPPLDGRITVLTQRNVLRLVYDMRGTLLSREARERGPIARPPSSAELPSGIVAPILAWLLASPFLALGVGFAGMLGVAGCRAKPARPVRVGAPADRPWDWRR